MPTLSETINSHDRYASGDEFQSSEQSNTTVIATGPATVRKFLSERSTPILDQIWHLSRRHRDTCFLMPRTELPDELAQQFTERKCLVVPAKTRWDIAAVVYSKDASIGYAELALQSGDTNDLKVVLALNNKTLLIDFDGLRERAFQAFETELPIVYKEQDSCALVVHPYRPNQLDLLLKEANASLTTDWHDTGLSFEDEIRRRLRCNLPRNIIVITNCVDMAGVAEHD
jgi:hypothetical protein